MNSKQRSYCMSRIKGKNTTPEMQVRRTFFAKGYRYRIHVKNLPGTPDIFFPSRRLAVFVHGCFWHRHRICRSGKSIPRCNEDYWTAKFNQNKVRDRRNKRQLILLGYRVAIIWECETKNLIELSVKLGCLMSSHRRLSR